jgi:hypothetical protein
MWNGWRLFYSLVLGSTLALALVFAPRASAQYPSEVEINLPPPPQFIENFGQKVISFFGVETFAREIRSIDFYELFAKGRRLAAEKIPRYRAELRRFCPAGCNLPELVRSAWSKARSRLGK